MSKRQLSIATVVAVAVLAAGMQWLLSILRPLVDAQQMAGPPPELWSIKVWGEPNPGRAVEICVDDKLRTGFVSLTADFGGAPCPIAFLRRHNWGQTYKCNVGDREFGVSTTVSGARDHDFIARSSVTDLDTAETLYARALRFQRLGPCPRGWPVGDATNQQGRRVAAAYMDESTVLAYPHN